MHFLSFISLVCFTALCQVLCAQNTTTVEQQNTNSTIIEDYATNNSIVEHHNTDSTPVEDHTTNSTTVEDHTINTTTVEHRPTNSTTVEDHTINTTTVEHHPTNSTTVDHTTNSTTVEHHTTNSTAVNHTTNTTTVEHNPTNSTTVDHNTNTTTVKHHTTNINDGCENFYSTPHVADVDSDLYHPCLRSCNGSTPAKCFYKFKVEWYVTMSKACANCPFNIADCLRPDCVVADGFERAIVTVNRRLPGPSIQVCEGDAVIVDVINELMSDSTTIHWHGLHQIGTPYMDGVPFLNQCPIQPGTTFRYHFLANMPGTHYWHSHSGMQRNDGMFGSLIVRARDDPHVNLYDVDDPEHVMLLTDWMNKLGIISYDYHVHTMLENQPYNILVNGLGKHTPVKKDKACSYPPLYEFKVQKGLRYRFRSISNSIQMCPIEVSVDNHTLLVIASDGQNIQPVEVESLVLYAGERWDFVVHANQDPGTYWVKYRGLLDCDERYFAAHQVAVLRYDEETKLPSKPEDVNYAFTKREGPQLNTLNAAPGDLTTVYTTADVKSLDNITDPSPFAGEPDYKFCLEFNFNSKDNNPMSLHQPMHGVQMNMNHNMPQINNISLKFPNVPPLSQSDELDPSLFCNSTSQTDCSKRLCSCTHMLNVKLGSLVEFILIETGEVEWSTHPFHMHGHAFAVLGMGRLGETTNLEAVEKLDKNGKLLRNFKAPPLKDSVTIPKGGYTVIRFVASNPGYWLFHCHISFHAEMGMGLILHVGEKTDLPPVPPKFPTCGSWVPSLDVDLQAELDSQANPVILEISPTEKNDLIPYEILRQGIRVVSTTESPRGESSCPWGSLSLIMTVTLLQWLLM